MVYFMQGEAGGPVKIGYAKDAEAVERRRRDLQTGNPSPLVVRRTMEGTMALEAEFHALFAADRLMGEWFVLTPALAAICGAVSVAVFDYDYWVAERLYDEWERNGLISRTVRGGAFITITGLAHMEDLERRVRDLPVRGEVPVA